MIGLPAAITRTSERAEAIAQEVFLTPEGRAGPYPRYHALRALGVGGLLRGGVSLGVYSGTVACPREQCADLSRPGVRRTTNWQPPAGGAAPVTAVVCCHRDRPARKGRVDAAGVVALHAGSVTSAVELSARAKEDLSREQAWKEGIRMFRCVVVATDGSRTAEVAVQHAIDLARRCDARLHVVSARRPSGALVATTLEAAGLVGTCLNEEVDAQSQLAAALERQAAELRTRGVDVVVHCEVGDPADVIVQTAERVGADVVVVGNRGMQRRVLGSVPNTVSHTVPCSVLIVRTS